MKYRRKVGTVVAMKHDGSVERARAIHAAIPGAMLRGGGLYVPSAGNPAHLLCPTPGDWVVGESSGAAYLVAGGLFGLLFEEEREKDRPKPAPERPAPRPDPAPKDPPVPGADEPDPEFDREAKDVLAAAHEPAPTGPARPRPTPASSPRQGSRLKPKAKPKPVAGPRAGTHSKPTGGK